MHCFRDGKFRGSLTEKERLKLRGEEGEGTSHEKKYKCTHSNFKEIGRSQGKIDGYKTWKKPMWLKTVYQAMLSRML